MVLGDEIVRGVMVRLTGCNLVPIMLPSFVGILGKE